MMRNVRPFWSARASSMRISSGMKAFLHLAILAVLVVTTAGPAWAAGPDDEYLKIFGLIDQADSFNQSGQTNAATAKYREAHAALLNFRRSYPTWNAKIVSYRLNYVSGKISALSPPVAVSVPEEQQPSRPAASPPGTQVRVLTAGAEPRQALRFRAADGDLQAVDITVSMSMGMTAPGAPGDMMKMPGMKMAVAVLPTTVSADGDINYEVLVEDVGVADEPGSMPEVVEAMKASLRGMTGLVIVCTMSDRGANKKAEARIPPGADAETRESIQQLQELFSNMEFLLPEEAVGPGARWEVKQKIRTQGMTIDQTATHELVSIEGDVVTAKSVIGQHAANQKISNPVTPQIQAHLTRLTGKGSGTLKIDLTRILPSQGAAEDHTEMNIVMDAGGQRQAMIMKTDVNIRLESK